MRLTLFSVLGLMVILSFTRYDTPSTVVKTASGLISGIADKGDGVRIFKGIPFAAPPVGHLRWKAPQPVKPWTGVRKCDSFGPSPMQSPPVPFGVYSQEFLIPTDGKISEDCLYLNVWTAAKSSRERRPVLVWIYGGGFVAGSGSVPIYNGRAMAKKGVVFVTFNYRVGCFGFFAHPALSGESPQKASGNYGLMDQIAALQWVKRNIAAFGGDPSNVTIDGQSAGAVSVNCLVASPLAKGLFKRAIAESGACVLNKKMLTLHEAENVGTRISQSLGASSMEALRKVPAEKLLHKVFQLRSPIVDGYVLPESVGEIFKTHKENKVDLLTGWNAGEKAGEKVKSAADFRHWAQETFGKDTAGFLQYYPARNDSEAAVSQVAYGRDSWAGVQGYVWAMLQRQTRTGKVYVYNFTRKLPAEGSAKKYGAFHSGEIVYALDNLPFLNRPWQDVDDSLANMMSSYWVNFATSGNPNARGLPKWPAFDENQDSVMIFSVQPNVAVLPHKDALNFLYHRIEEQPREK